MSVNQITYKDSEQKTKKLLTYVIMLSKSKSFSSLETRLLPPQYLGGGRVWETAYSYITLGYVTAVECMTMT